MPKYPQNDEGLYDCPRPRCRSKGDKGLTSPQAVGMHLRHHHGIGLNGKTKVGRKAQTSEPVEVDNQTPLLGLLLTLWDNPAVQRASREQLQEVFNTIINRKALIGI